MGVCVFDCNSRRTCTMYQKTINRTETMSLVTHIFITGLITSAIGCVLDHPGEANWERKLSEDLKHDYNVNIPPKPSKCENITVDISFILKYFNLYNEDNTLVMQTWMHISWYDERLKWDPEKYGGLTETEIHSTYIWIPRVKLFNALYSESDTNIYIECGIQSSGKVSCSPRFFLQTSCDIKLRDFPHDAQECSLEFGPWEINTNYFKMNFTDRAMRMWGADYGSQWLISEYKQRSEASKQLIMTFVFEREAESLAAVLIYPSLIISFLTIISLFLDVRNNVRLMFICFSIFNHYYWLVELGENIPTKSVDIPRLLLYYRGSMILTALLFVITFVLTVICKKKTAPHNIINSINNFFQGSYARFILFPFWNVDNTEKDDENNFTEDWIKFANAFNSLCIIVFITTYVALYLAFIPQPIPFN